MPDIALTGTVPVSARVREAFLRRVHALPAASRDLLLVAAAEETGDAGTVLGAAARLDLSADALRSAERAELVEVAGTELRFRHSLVRSAVYADASFERRRAAHHAITDELAAGAETDRATWHRAVVATGPDERLAAALESGRPDLARTLVDRIMTEPVPPVTLARLVGTVELYSGDPAVAYAHLLRCAELTAPADAEEAAWILTLASGAAFHSGDTAAGPCGGSGNWTAGR